MSEEITWLTPEFGSVLVDGVHRGSIMRISCGRYMKAWIGKSSDRKTCWYFSWKPCLTELLTFTPKSDVVKPIIWKRPALVWTEKRVKKQSSWHFIMKGSQSIGTISKTRYPNSPDLPYSVALDDGQKEYLLASLEEAMQWIVAHAS